MRRISFELGDDRSLRDISVADASSKEFAEWVRAGAESLGPVTSVSSDHLSCLRGTRHSVRIRLDRSVACDERERSDYVSQIQFSIYRAFHGPEHMEAPGSGRISVQLKVAEDGSLEEARVLEADTPALEAKFDRIVEAFQPIGPRPGAAACWGSRSIVWFDVIGSDAASAP